ncbi:MAG: CAP domain-containing protein [Lachnospiraceae bacterium]|nr:CAP domain-containing protein [Lachnospiraceae bacterium]
MKSNIVNLKNKIGMIAGIVVAGALVVVAAVNSGEHAKGIDEGAAFRSAADIASDEYHYFDSEAVALADSSGENSELRAEAMKAGELINEIREDNGLGELDWDMNLEQVAEVRSQEASEYWDHVRPDGSPWNTVNSDIQGGENLAYGQDDAKEVTDDWMASTTHRDNILYPDFEKGAIAVYEADDGTWYWSQQFGY